MTIFELESYGSICKELKRIEEKLKEMRSSILYPKISTFKPMIQSNEKHDFTDMEIKIEELEEFYLEKKKEKIIKLVEVENLIENFINPQDRLLMGYKYIDGLTFEQIGEKMKKSDKTIKRWHKRILNKMNNI